MNITLCLATAGSHCCNMLESKHWRQKFKLENDFVLWYNDGTTTLNRSRLSREQQLCRAVLRPVVLSISVSLACVIQSREL